MTTPVMPRRGFASRFALVGIRASLCLLTLFATLAVYFSTMQPGRLRIAVAVLALLGGVALLALRVRRAAIGLLAYLLVFATWYTLDRPTGDRDWATEYAVPATVAYSGRIVSIGHIRNFSYRSEDDLSPAYYDASFSLDDLSGVDLVASYWAGDAIAHVFVTFGFRDGRHLAFSIETRRRKSDVYSTVAGFFHHYELFYVVADERDVIGVRTDVRHERVYLYAIHTTPQVREELFLSYLAKVASLAQHPEWYNTLTDNCTTGILGRANAGTPDVAYNWRVLLSGYAAEYAYRLGLLDPAENFAAVQQRSRIVRPADARIDAGFSAEIRQERPS